MIVTENPAAAAELIRRANAYNQALHPRAEGLHVSDLIYCRRKAWYRKQARQADVTSDEYDTDTLVMFLLGHGYHALLEQGIDERKVVLIAEDPAGRCHEIHGTIDGEVRPDGSPHEFKTTRLSLGKRLITDSQHYIEQVASYCLGLDADHGLLTVVYINGNYKPPKPTIRTYDLEFTSDELVRWRDELGFRAACLLDMSRPPALPCHRTWECGYCPYNQKVGGPCPAGPGEQRHWFLPDTLPSFVEDVLEEG